MEPNPPRELLLEEDECEMLEVLDLLDDEPELNQEREEEEELPAEPTRIASIACALGLGRPSVRLEPKYGGP